MFEQFITEFRHFNVFSEYIDFRREPSQIFNKSVGVNKHVGMNFTVLWNKLVSMQVNLII